MIGGVKAGAFENHLGRSDDLLQCLLAALGAGLQGIIGEGLLLLELDSAIITAIGIDGHTYSPCFFL